MKDSKAELVFYNLLINIKNSVLDSAHSYPVEYKTEQLFLRPKEKHGVYYHFSKGYYKNAFLHAPINPEECPLLQFCSRIL